KATSRAFIYAEPSCGSEAFNPSKDSKPVQALGLLVEARTWQPHFSTWDRAWAWAKARTFFAEQRRPGLEQRLEAELEAATAREMRLTAELAAEQA
ncbi:hypothetical protein, partial [Streptosporangium sp. NPDC002721]|uniref:hypothetical protein n=1 Tax=Streptosporangium sp. NPDC002721 TaxID=3366188 RepID=UPI0036987190